MMMDIDTLSRRLGPLIALHCYIANILHRVDIRNILDAYDENTFMRDGQTKVNIKLEIYILSYSMLRFLKHLPNSDPYTYMKAKKKFYVGSYVGVESLWYKEFFMSMLF